MRRLALILILLSASTLSLYAQYNKAYFYYIGRQLIIDSRFEEAIGSLNVLLSVDGKAYEGYFLRGIAKYNLDDLIGAEHDFSLAIDNNPVFTMAYQYRAITRSRLGNYDDALNDFREAIDLRPDLPGPYYSRGVTYLLSQQYDKAVEDFTRYIRYESRSADAYINRGAAYLYMNDTVRALEDYNTAIRTNRENPNGYNRRGALYMAQEDYAAALEDFNMAVESDTTYTLSFFNRAIVYSSLNRPMQSLADFDRVIALDSTNSLTYFNRALVRTQIGDYNRALEDYGQVAIYSPSNVLVYYNRAGLYAHLGNIDAAIGDYTRAIELYPDFANAYLFRSELRYLKRDMEGAQEDRMIADAKIAEYRNKLSDSTFSIYADTSRRFNQLLSFDTRFGGGSSFDRIGERSDNITLMPLFKFTLERDRIVTIDPRRYFSQPLADFLALLDNSLIKLSNGESDIPADTLIIMDRAIAERQQESGDWRAYFERGITQSLIRQYTNSINNYSEAINRDPTNPFLYINRSTTRSEMIDFISSIDDGFQRYAVDSDPVNRLRGTSTRIFNYDEAIEDLNKAAKLLPDFAHIYYNRANLKALSGDLPGAYDDYTLAIDLNPNFGEAYYNRGLVQIYLKDTRKGCLDVSKAGELGISEAYNVLRRYGQYDN